MLWVIHCIDEPDAAERRGATRAEHSARLASAAVKAILYGPLLGVDERTPVGSLIVVEAAEYEEVKRFVAQDPFVRERVWREIHIHGFLESTRSPSQIG